MVIGELKEGEKEVLLVKYSSLGYTERQAKRRLEEVVTQLRIPLAL